MRARWTRLVAAGLALGVAIAALWAFALVRGRRPAATVLMYHSVTDEATGDEPSITRTLFAQQMAFIASHGYETVFVKDVVARYETKTPVPARWLALTFDGGDPGFYTSVYPVLRRLGLKATLYVIVGEVGRPGALTWDRLREMSTSGLVAIDSHSWDHVADECRAPEEARREKALSKSVLEANLGVRVVTYAYPYGAFTNRAKRLLREEGYRGAVGTVYRRGEFDDGDDDVFNLRRVYVSGVSRLPLMFRFMLSGYYVPTRSMLLRVLDIRTPRDIGCPRTVGP
jgi:peptidoglycan/xylan/chitin deacetylase (PgdA/CDA1 family)